MTTSLFRISQAALDRIVAHARAADPAECCGMLIGAGTAIDETALARNIADSPTRFLIDPRDHIDARRKAHGRGLEVVGFYHSHPHSPAEPSPTDIDEAYPEAVHLIVSLAEGVPKARLFRIGRGSAEELPLVVGPSL